MDLETVKVAEICKISEKTIDKIFRAIRIKMAENCEQQAKLSGEIETRESYFGAKRVRGKRERGASGKTPVFHRNILLRKSTSLVLGYLNETVKSILK